MVIIRQPTEDELKEMFFLRWKNLSKPFNRKKGKKREKGEENSIFAIAIEKDKIIGSATLTIESSSAEISWVNVDKNNQKNNIGRRLMLFLHDIANKNGVKKIWISSRDSAEQFYNKLGYSKVGDYFDSPPTGIHIKMEFFL